MNKYNSASGVKINEYDLERVGEFLAPYYKQTTEEKINDIIHTISTCDSVTSSVECGGFIAIKLKYSNDIEQWRVFIGNHMISSLKIVD